MKAWISIPLLCMGIALTACNTPAEVSNDADLLRNAAAEATRIIQQAQATAMVLEAQSQATALIARSGEQPGLPTGTAEPGNILPVQPPEVQNTLPPAGQGSPTQTPVAQTVELLGVELGNEGYFVVVYFRAPPAVAGLWYQGNVSVKDEAFGAEYSEIPVLPTVGPLFGKPVEAGQIGYVMFVNAPVPLRSGARVTVTLGEYVFKHIPVK